MKDSKWRTMTCLSHQKSQKPVNVSINFEHIFQSKKIIFPINFAFLNIFVRPTHHLRLCLLITILFRIITYPWIFMRKNVISQHERKFKSYDFVRFWVASKRVLSPYSSSSSTFVWESIEIQVKRKHITLDWQWKSLSSKRISLVILCC